MFQTVYMQLHSVQKILNSFDFNKYQADRKVCRIYTIISESLLRIMLSNLSFI
jgi:hypothetical protein